MNAHIHCTGNRIKSTVSMMHSLCLQFVHSTVCAILSATYKSANLNQETFMETSLQQPPQKFYHPKTANQVLLPVNHRSRVTTHSNQIQAWSTLQKQWRILDSCSSRSAIVIASLEARPVIASSHVFCRNASMKWQQIQQLKEGQNDHQCFQCFLQNTKTSPTHSVFSISQCAKWQKF